jgi:hypothetical protein
MDGAQVVFAFWRPTAVNSGGNQRIEVLQQKLFGFRKVFVRAGEATTIQFSINADDLAVADEAGDRYLHTGDYAVAFSYGEESEIVKEVQVVARDATPKLVESRAF